MPAPQKSRLGRGLGGLIAASKPVVTAQPAPSAAAAPTASKPASAPAAVAPAAPSAPGYQEVPVNLIDPSPYQARKEIAPEHLSELAESIRSEGLLQPVVVRKAGDRFQLIAGERRWRAFQMLKIRAIPARVVEASNASSAALGLIE
ncbi:MAG: ParB N-terminal domain-containing protein, partial [Opitutaceae bacterium]